MGVVNVVVIVVVPMIAIGICDVGGVASVFVGMMCVVVIVAIVVDDVVCCAV